MRLLTSVFILVTLLVVAGVAPVSAAILYDNGPLNGTLDAFTINYGYIVTDSFTLTDPGTVTGANFFVWASPGDQMTNVDWAFTSDHLGGTVYASGTASTTQTDYGPNAQGYELEWENISFPGLILGPGTYWFQLQNAVVPGGDPIFWDENDGISAAWDSGIGNLQNFSCDGCSGSETFQLTGSLTTVPEPASLGLIGMGLLGMAALLRRRISK